jgi:WD40 repeat protein
MSRLFISHSSRNNDTAIEVRDWLAANGWRDIFLDLDPERGIAAGQRWKEALQKAAYRCELVLALVSNDWLASSWSKSEVDAARLMGKKVIVALVGIDNAQVPRDLTDEQFIDLTGDPQAYRRLKEGLKRAGLDPTTFPFEAGRRPYPGFAYLEEQDAAVFFGRDAQIVRGLDDIRRLVRTGVARMLVIVGASGSGKSSFLRAGLWPRLKRDDQAWLPLPVIRPERAAISGKYGLAEALRQVMSKPRFSEGVRQRSLPRSRADIQDFIEKRDDGLLTLFSALRDITLGAFSSTDAATLTIILALDQGEELFNEEGRDEAARLVEILTKTLKADSRTLAILVVRSDSFPLVQSNESLAELPKETFTRDMMLQGSYREVIEGPARLTEPPLKIDPLLTDALLKDISGQDALPLLAFTLAHLHDNYRADKELTLAGYDKIGRVEGVIRKTVAQGFSEPVARGEARKDARAQLAIARAAFIPHLAQVNAAGQFVRRVAAREEIPAEARPLIDRFTDQRLLTRDRRQDVEVIEVAHEALLRQPPFSDWLAEDREFLIWLERLSQARAAFAAQERGLFAGRELAIACGYMQTRAEREIEPADQAFIRESIAADDERIAEEAEQARAKEIAEREEQERRVRDAERIAAEQRKAAIAGRRTAQVALAGLAVALLVAGLAFWQYFAAEQAKKEAVAQSREAQTQRDIAVQAQKDANEAKLEAQANAHKAEASAEEAKTNLREAQVAQEAADQAKKDALGQRDRAVQAEGAANKAKEEAEASANEAKARLREAQITQSQFLADLAGQQRASDDTATAALLALEALPDAVAGTARPYVPEAEVQLDGALRDLREQLVTHHYWQLSSGAFSPDGKRIVTSWDDNTARISDAASGQPIGESLKGHTGIVNSASFSPDGKRIVTSSDDNTARVWDAASGQPIGAPLKGHVNAVRSASFSPDGKRIVTTSFDDTARIWDADSGQPIGEPLSHGDVVSSAAFSPDGQRVVTASYDKTARIWDVASGKLIGEPLKGHEEALYSASFSPDGKRIITASWDKTARIWDGTSGKPIAVLTGHKASVYSAAFSPDGRRIVTASHDKTARIWDAANGQLIGEPLKGHDDAVVSASFSPDGLRIVTASYDKTARIWDAASGQQIGEPLKGHEGRVTSASFSPNGKRILTASEDGTARIWDAATGHERRIVHEQAVVWAAYSPDGKRIVTASEDKTIRIWDASSGQPIGAPLRVHAVAYIAALSPDGSRIVTASTDQTAQIWDASRGKPIGALLKSLSGGFGSVAFSLDGARIVTEETGGTRIWDAMTGTPIASKGGRNREDVYSARFSPDGKRYADINDADTLRILDNATDKQIVEIGHNDVRSAAFSRDGKRIVTASTDGTVRVWDSATGSPVGDPLKGHGDQVYAAFSPNGKNIVTASRDKTAWIWDVFPDTQSLVEAAKAAVPRCLKPKQREAVFLPPEPPAWCIEMAKWPYDTPGWKQWLADKRAGNDPPLPAGQ